MTLVKPSFALGILVALLTLFFAQASQAAQFRWTGAVNSNWSVTGNWQEFSGSDWIAASAAPGSSDYVHFGDATANNTAQTIVLDTGDVTVQYVIMEATGNRSYTVQSAVSQDYSIIFNQRDFVQQTTGATQNLIFQSKVQANWSNNNTSNRTQLLSTSAARVVLANTLTSSSHFEPIGADDSEGILEIQGLVTFSTGNNRLYFSRFDSKILLNSSVTQSPARALWPDSSAIIWAQQNFNFGAFDAFSSNSRYATFQIFDAESDDVRLQFSSLSRSGIINALNPDDGSTGDLYLRVTGDFVPSTTDNITQVNLESKTFLELGGNQPAPAFANEPRAIQGEGGLIKYNDSVSTIGTANTYTGGTFIQDGTLRLVRSSIPATSEDPNVDYDGALGTGGLYVSSPGTFDLNGLTQTVSGLHNDPVNNLGGSVLLGDGTLTIDGAGAASFDGVIAGSGGVVKQGVGTQTFTGANTYTGSTLVTAGTLVINGSLASSTVTVGVGGILGGSGSIDGTVVVSGSLRPGNSIGTLTIEDSVTWNGGEDWVFELGAGDTSDLLDITGVSSDFLKGTGSEWRFDFAGSTHAGTFTLVQWTGTSDFIIDDFSYVNLGGGNNGSFSFDGNSLQFSAIPEPGTSGLALLAGGLLYLLRRGKINV